MRSSDRTANSIWKFNALFERYPMEEAVKKACEMERQRAYSTQVSLLQEIYSSGWTEWRDMPGGQLVQDLIEWDDGIMRDNRDQPWFPKFFANPYVWNGEVSSEQLRQIELSHFSSLTVNGPTSVFSSTKAYLDGNRELSELSNWWTLDEQTHEEMHHYQVTKHFGFSEEQLFAVADKKLMELKNEKVRQIDKNMMRTLNKFLALRDGPAILVGVMMLIERENPWTNQNSAKAYKKHYGFTDDELVLTNVHTYIDIFHSRLGQYVIGRYARTAEEQELVRAFYMSQKQKQMENSKVYLDSLFHGKKLEVSLDGNIG